MIHSKCTRPVSAAMLGLMLILALTSAAATSAETNLEQRLSDFLRAQAPATGEVQVAITPSRAALSECRNPKPFLPGRNARVAGNLTVGVQCPGDRPATRYYQARVSVVADYYVAARALMPGDVLGMGDIRRERGDLSRLPQNVATNTQALLGMAVTRRVAAGRPLGARMVKQPVAIKRGERVRVIATGTGFSITTQGKALNGAPLGGSVRVSTNDGSVVVGTSTDANTVTLRQ